MQEPKKRRALIITIVLSLIPAVLLVKFPSVISAKSIALYGSAIAGYAGMVVLLWSYILGAKSVMGLIFRDLAPVLTIHKWLGKYGTLAIFVHPVLIAYSYGVSLLYAILPDASTRFESHVTLGRISLGIIAILWLTSAILRSRISFRPWRYIHLLGYIALPFAFLHVPDVGSQFMASTAVKGYFFLLLVVFMVFTLLRLRGLLNIDKSLYEIVSQKQLVSDDPSIWLLQLRPQRDAIRPGKGQYVYLKDGYISEEHPFSVLDYDEKSGDISIAYRTFGRFTKGLSAKPVGSRLFVGGPYGEFTREISADETKPVVFVAGGIGVTPMVRYLIEQDTTREQWLFYANRTKDSAMMVPELRGVLGERLVTAYSRQKEGPKPRDERGHLSAEMFSKHLAEPAKYCYFLCGSDQMMQSIASELKRLGVPPASIHREAFAW